MVTPTTAQLPPQGRADSPPLTNHPDGHHKPYPSAPTHAHQYVTNAPPSLCPNTPHNPLGATESGNSPAGGPTVHHCQLPRLVSLPGSWPVPTLRRQRAVQLRNTATPPTNTVPERPPLADDLRK
jgi:hypothetical protein